MGKLAKLVKEVNKKPLNPWYWVLFMVILIGIFSYMVSSVNNITRTLSSVRVTTNQSDAAGNGKSRAELILGTVGSKTKQAELVVVGDVESAETNMQTNEYGDQLIVTRGKIKVSDALKGSASEVEVEMLGGTYNGITMAASEHPDPVSDGESAIMFLKKDKHGKLTTVPGEDSVLRLDSDKKNVEVESGSLTVDQVKAEVAKAK